MSTSFREFFPKDLLSPFKINALKLFVRNNWKTIYGSISVNSLDKPQPDEIRVGDKVKGGLCVARSRSKLHPAYTRSLR
ncbi:hypothetical protein ALC53_09498 [Atta colombica]|uniref:Uncharacterized protein n=1 Tax=Atta colombica TaxID=520822 RepID=A0A195B6S9_9HYME|nr:hypothetical protein ALC53_09498 [Atta colombica]